MVIVELLERSDDAWLCDKAFEYLQVIVYEDLAVSNDAFIYSFEHLLREVKWLPKEMAFLNALLLFAFLPVASSLESSWDCLRVISSIDIV